MGIKRIKPILIAATIIFLISFVISQADTGFSKEKKHKKLYEAEILATFPPGTFLENLVSDEEGNLYITSIFDKTILKYSYADNSVSVFARLEDNPGGIAIDHDGTIYVGAHLEGVTGSNKVLKINKQGEVSLLMNLSEAQNPNGWAYVKPGIFLICDSDAGVIWKLDVKHRTLTEWLRDELLEKRNMDPGANGIKLYRNFAFVSNSSQAILLRITMDRNCNPVEIEVYKDVALDDFCISEDGDIYGTTHPENLIYLIKKRGEPEVIAEGEEDGVRGNSAAVFGKNRGDSKSIYVIGDGGWYEAMIEFWTTGKLDYSKMKPSALTRIYVGEKGYRQKGVCGDEE
jgi:hypothetical protein